ncbi:hypothetical protein L3X38_002416 [Prunus dulcis]|uniref:Uncharacterized protein n=1 Tax=Prunus dulcis TaxID=3755 RepID=A0AAD4WUE9_PRUDU|nr:hypothetical protein L3X38_002416 [Prunus dulcis]
MEFIATSVVVMAMVMTVAMMVCREGSGGGGGGGSCGGKGEGGSDGGGGGADAGGSDGVDIGSGCGGGDGEANGGGGDGIEEDREGRSKVEGSRSEYSPVRLFAQTFGAFIESTSYTQRVLKESVPPIFQSTEAFQTTMVGSKRTRSKTASMAQSVTAQSYFSHDPTIDMAALPPLAAMNPQQPPRVTRTTVPLAGLAVRTTAPASAAVVPSQGPMAGPSHLYSTTVEHGGALHLVGLTTTADFGPILEQLQPFPPLPPRSTHAPTYTSNETLARVQLGSTHFSHPDPRSQVDLNMRVDQLTQRMDNQNNLMRQLLNQINLAQNLGLGQ